MVRALTVLHGFFPIVGFENSHWLLSMHGGGSLEELSGLQGDKPVNHKKSVSGSHFGGSDFLSSFFGPLVEETLCWKDP